MDRKLLKSERDRRVLVWLIDVIASASASARESDGAGYWSKYYIIDFQEACIQSRIEKKIKKLQSR